MNKVEVQYRSSDPLRTRISLHAKYSTNHQPFGDWIMSHYAITPGDRILELGCGTGDMWRNHLNLLTSGTTLTLTDFSAGMLETAKCTLPPLPNITYQVTDIQNIPYPDHSFDIVIANMMLYHVPDLHLGLSQVRRVLKPGGTFYCATFGQHGIHEYVYELLQDLHFPELVDYCFTLQNGAASLERHFSQVTRLNREDGLAITDIRDFADYIESLPELTNTQGISRDALLKLLESRVENGILFVPKEYGMFICK